MFAVVNYHIIYRMFVKIREKKLCTSGQHTAGYCKQFLILTVEDPRHRVAGCLVFFFFFYKVHCFGLLDASIWDGSCFDASRSHNFVFGGPADSTEAQSSLHEVWWQTLILGDLPTFFFFFLEIGWLYALPEWYAVSGIKLATSRRPMRQDLLLCRSTRRSMLTKKKKKVHFLVTQTANGRNE
ncbi:hypothetical protein BC940DRAFT_132139 [Gongronella butleri]|nr:hypothetical protein BC940DRAFT_132139 [Gongronella butleri]